MTIDSKIEKIEIPSLEESEKFCRDLCSHYENFTVGSLLFPRKMRQDLANFYAFCRYSDDLGDEGDALSESGRQNKIQKLNAWNAELFKCYDGHPEHHIFIALRKTILKYKIPPEPLQDLISAFIQDQTKQRYATFEELLEYCRFSANPVGRVYLMLFGYNDENLNRSADKICTALQLTNFWQDIARDLDKGRIYIPLEDMKKYNYSEDDLKAKKYNENFRILLEFELNRTFEMFNEGSILENYLPSDIAFEVTLFRRGGEAILRKIEKQNYTVLKSRPVLTKFDKLKIFLSSYIRSRM